MDLVIKLSKPIEWEEKTYTEIDLRPIRQMRFKDKREAMRLLRADGGHDVLKPEADERYLMAIAARMSGIPIEMLDELPIYDSNAVEQAVQSFLLGADSEKEPTER
jgi:hypothetical protein